MRKYLNGFDFIWIAAHCLEQCLYMFHVFRSRQDSMRRIWENRKILYRNKNKWNDVCTLKDSTLRSYTTVTVLLWYWNLDDTQNTDFHNHVLMYYNSICSETLLQTVSTLRLGLFWNFTTDSLNTQIRFKHFLLITMFNHVLFEILLWFYPDSQWCFLSSQPLWNTKLTWPIRTIWSV